MKITGSYNIKPVLDQTKETDSKLKEACEDFEAVLTNFMLSKMRSSIPKDELVQSDGSEEIMKSMLDEKIAEEVSRTDSIGLSDMLYKQLSSMEKK